LFTGPTSGAAYQVGSWWARRHPDALTVVVLPDEGHRYQDTVYRDEWLAASGLAVTAPAPAPVTVTDPRAAEEGWSRFAWQRRSLAEATAGSALAGAAS
jgi:cysteine synthase A